MTKIDIISGFLGAGKTTLIKKLLKEALQGEQVVLIENEFGEIGIDGGFLKEAGVEITEMNSGCICCSLVGDFASALKQVLDQYHPDRILIEPSGVGKLSDVMRAVEGATGEAGVHLNSAVAVVDAKKCKTYLKNFGEFFENQIEHAGTIILSRTGEMSEEKINQCIGLIRQHNEKAAIITTPWDELDGKKIMEAIEGAKDLEAELLKAVMEEHEHEHHHHHADDVFTSWGTETPKKYEKAELDSILKKLSESEDYGKVLRSKGMLPCTDGTWMYFDLVPEEYEIREGSADFTGRICVIGSELKEDALKELFEV